tara:strand:- start:1578 stop:2351 length:774 start_codon:yes stop_codon:yes gene_type:complete
MGKPFFSDPKHLSYIDGDEFSPALSLDLDFLPSEPNNSRQDTICSIVSSKKVLHIGCTDHLPVIDEKISAGRHLHAALIEVCEKVIGVDIDQPSIDHLTQNYNMSDIYNVDLVSTPLDKVPFTNEGPFEYAIMGEIVEHLDNPVQFLSKLRSEHGTLFNKLIVTVPNAFNHNVLKEWKRGKETINSDHRFWFSPYTITRVLSAAGYKVESIRMADVSQKMDIFSRGLNRFYSMIGSTKRLRVAQKYGATVIAIASQQ